MSKFFGYSSSETESEIGEEEVAQIEAPKPTRTYTRVFEASDEELDEAIERKRVIKSEKEKRAEDLNNYIRQLKNAEKIKDVSKVSQIFDDSSKYYEKCNKVIEKEGHFKQYIRALAELDGFVSSLWSDASWKSSTVKTNLASLSKLRQKIKKYNRNFENEIENFKKSPHEYPKGEEEIEEVEEEKAVVEEEVEEEEIKKETSSEEETPTSSEWSPEEGEKTTSDEESELDESERWKKFLKKEKITPISLAKKPLTPQKVPREKPAQIEPIEKKIDKHKLFAENEEITHASLLRKVDEIFATRGRKIIEKSEQLELLDELANVALKHDFGPAVQIKILYCKIIISFDYNPSLNYSMKIEYWKNCLNCLNGLLDLVCNDENIELSEKFSEDEENYSDAKQRFKIRANLIALAERLSEEYVKILQQTDPYGIVYIDRLKLEPSLSQIIDRVLEYYEHSPTTTAEPQDMCSIYLRKIETFYFKYDAERNESDTKCIDKLCKFIYTNDETDRLRTKAILYHIYQHALSGRYAEARDLFLMSHLQENIDKADVQLQVLYNRTLVQIGLCAFRCGLYREAHDALIDIQVSNRARELLAQGVVTQRNVLKTKEEEVKERQRLIPFHMHINIELVEFVYLVCAILLEIPYMCSSEFETKKRLISRQFFYQLKVSEKQAVTGPPESMREHVMAAARAMRNADWRLCLTYLINNEKIEARVWRLVRQNVNSVKDTLTRRVKEEAMRAYLFKYSAVYDSLSVEFLREMFDLDLDTASRIVSKMIAGNELMASLDQPTQMIVMHRTEPTKLQRFALQLADKVTGLTELAEKMISLKGGELGVVFKPQIKRR